MSEPKEKKPGFFRRLREGMSRSAGKFKDFFKKRKLDRETLDELEELLIGADLGPSAAARVIKQLARDRFEKEIGEDELKEALAGEVAAILKPVETALPLDAARKPNVVLVVGVNGSGKTTTIGKLAKRLTEGGKRVMLAAGDTFRAAAIEQLKIWGERTGAPVIAKAPGADSAGLAFEALEKARAEGRDVLLIDTAGRLQNKATLMAELEKIVRVLRKLDPTAPHATLLVLDATTGQNALAQAEVFQSVSGVSGLVMTKLDGTARGGVLVAIAEKTGLPIHWIGVGEAVEDLQPFDALAFARALVGAAGNEAE
jgi:fused signal recognition particle receptor